VRFDGEQALDVRLQEAVANVVGVISFFAFWLSLCFGRPQGARTNVSIYNNNNALHNILFV